MPGKHLLANRPTVVLFIQKKGLVDCTLTGVKKIKESIHTFRSGNKEGVLCLVDQFGSEILIRKTYFILAL